MEDKSIEELQAELEALKKANLEAELAKEKAKAEEEQRLSKEADMEKLRDEIRSEILDEIESGSQITKDEPVTMNAPNSDFEEFKGTFAKKLGITGDPYDKFIHKVVFKGYSK